MKNLEKKIHHLHVLANSSPQLRKAIIKYGDRDLIMAICECILNFLNGNINADADLVKKAGKHKKILRKILEPISIKKKKDLLIQSGGFLPMLIPTILGVISNLLIN